MTKTKRNNVKIQGLIILSHNPIPNDTNTQQPVDNIAGKERA